MTVQSLASFQLPILALLLFNTLLVAQDSSNPFTRVPNEVAANKAVDRDNAKLKALESQMRDFQEEYARMAQREQALNKTIQELQEYKKTASLATNLDSADEALKARNRQLVDETKKLTNELRSVNAENQALKDLARSSQDNEAKAKEIADNAVRDRNEMHQALFETLLKSQDTNQQELALTHLFTCVDKYPPGKGVPVNIYTPELLRRIHLLTESDSTRVRRLASKSLFAFKPDMSMDAGFQFGPRWKPLEHVKSNSRTVRLYHLMDEPVTINCREIEFEEIMQDIEDSYGVNFRYKPGIDLKQVVSFKCDQLTLASFLAKFLANHDLSYAISDGEIVIMKRSDPAQNVDRTYNVYGLVSEQMELPKILEIIDQALEGEPVKLSHPGGHIFVAKAPEAIQRRIETVLGRLAPAASWYTN